MNSYLSVSWMVIRGAWFVDFMGEIMRLFVTDRQMGLKKAAIDAYDAKLGIHHPWILRKMIKVAFNAVTSRENFIKSYISEKKLVEGDSCDMSDEQVYKEIEEFQ